MRIAPAPYPAKKPRADITASVVRNTVYQSAMLQLQRTRTVDGVTQFYFTRADINKAGKTLDGPAKLAIDNMKRYFKANPKTKEATRDAMMGFIEKEARAEIAKAAGQDGIISKRETAKLPKHLRDDVKYVTTGWLGK